MRTSFYTTKEINNFTSTESIQEEKYELYEENFKSLIDNRYHTETYCTKNKNIYNEKEKHNRSNLMLYGVCYPGTVGCIMLFILFILTGIYTIGTKDIIPGWILISLSIICIIGMIVFIVLAKKYKKIFEQTKLWKTKFRNTEEYKNQQEKYTEEYRNNARQKQLEAANKLVNIWNILEGNKPYIDEEKYRTKICTLADVLNINDAENIINKNQ